MMQGIKWRWIVQKLVGRKSDAKHLILQGAWWRIEDVVSRTKILNMIKNWIIAPWTSSKYNEASCAWVWDELFNFCTLLISCLWRNFNFLCNCTHQNFYSNTRNKIRNVQYFSLIFFTAKPRYKIIGKFKNYVFVSFSGSNLEHLFEKFLLQRVLGDLKLLL